MLLVLDCSRKVSNFKVFITGHHLKGINGETSNKAATTLVLAYLFYSASCKEQLTSIGSNSQHVWYAWKPMLSTGGLPTFHPCTQLRLNEWGTEKATSVIHAQRKRATKTPTRALQCTRQSPLFSTSTCPTDKRRHTKERRKLLCSQNTRMTCVCNQPDIVTHSGHTSTYPPTSSRPGGLSNKEPFPGPRLNYSQYETHTLLLDGTKVDWKKGPNFFPLACHMFNMR